MAHASAAEIPKGFLLTEAKARKVIPPPLDDEEWWEISDKPSLQLELNPCSTKAKPRDGRVAMRTITHGTSAPSSSGEQLVLYRNATSAKAVLAKLRAELKRCSRGSYRSSATRLSVGDEAVFVTGHAYTKGKLDETMPPTMWAVARRGSAVFFYSDFADRGDGRILRDRALLRKTLAGDAKKMAKKVCDLPGVCR
ncbi:hypothetical protein [Microtetraspora sp. NBRC 16547]|uniref:hypothetical protein n=1 Tax=Microtetraspora sp. NBRC 16547 TaxID=3030993 RepID=UPI0024A04635|nr:hypothetical protein [Microtetraspora sp. NBRC 16547]GLW98147.1 hypothetical protein Misp02_22340 [Microtetraspora sp. NBRC 16547]